MNNYMDVINQAVETAQSNTGVVANNMLNTWLNPGLQQEEEFGQQAALQQQQVEFADERNRMKRLREAGVNPLTAAEGVSGGSSAGAASSPNTAQQSNTIPELANSIGNVADRVSSATERATLLEERKKNIISDTFLKYKEAGYTDLQAKGLAIANAYLPTEKFLTVMTMAANMDKLKAEYNQIMQGIDESKARVREIDQQIKLAIAQGNLADKLALEAEKRTLLLESQTIEQNWFNKIHKDYNIDPRNALENNILMLGITGSDKYEGAVQTVADTKFASETAGYQAERDYAQTIAYRRGKGAALAEVNYASAKDVKSFIFKMFEQAKGVPSWIQDFVRGVPDDWSAPKIRRSLGGVLGQMTSDNEFTDDPDYQSKVNQILDILSMSDEELEKWYRNQ